MKESWQEALVEKLAEKLVALDTMDGSTDDFLERSKKILREMSNRTLEKAAEQFENRVDSNAKLRYYEVAAALRQLMEPGK